MWFGKGMQGSIISRSDLAHFICIDSDFGDDHDHDRDIPHARHGSHHAPFRRTTRNSDMGTALALEYQSTLCSLCFVPPIIIADEQTKCACALLQARVYAAKISGNVVKDSLARCGDIAFRGIADLPNQLEAGFLAKRGHDLPSPTLCAHASPSVRRDSFNLE